MSRRGAISRLIVAALSLQLALPLMAGTLGPRASANAPSFEVVLCTPAGPKAVQVDEDGRVHPMQAPAPGFCPICLAVAAALTGPAQDWLVPLPGAGRPPLPRLQVTAAAVPTPAHGVPPVRAPPLV